MPRTRQVRHEDGMKGSGHSKKEGGRAQARGAARFRLCRLRRPRRAGRAGPLRSRARQGFLRRRLHRRHQGPQVAQDRRGRADHPAQSRASRRGRRRSARRRRRRHPGADPAQILRAEGGRDSASRCPRPANTPSAICSCRATKLARRSSARSTRDDRARGHGAARLARRADQQFDARRDR